MLALLCDPNNEKVREAAADNCFFEDIYDDAVRFSQDKGVQNMLFEEELAIMDYNTSIHIAKEEGIEETNAFYSWLFSNGRSADAEKAAKNKVIFDELFKEYKNSNITK